MLIDDDYHSQMEMKEQIASENRVPEVIDLESLYSYGPFEFGSDISEEIYQTIRELERVTDEIFAVIKSWATVEVR